MWQILLDGSQPMAVAVFVIAGMSALMLGLWTQGAINLCFAVANFFIFYGMRVIGR